MANLGDLLLQVGLEVGMKYATSGNERTLLIEWANDGVVDILRRTRCYKIAVTFTLTANDADYDLNTLAGRGVISLEALRGSSASGGKRIVRVSLDEIHDMRINEDVVPGPVRYWASEGGQLWVYPLPASGETLPAVIVPTPSQEMSADGNDPSTATYGGVPVQYHTALQFYMKWRAARYDDKEKALDPIEELKIYEAEVARIRGDERHRGGRKLPRARVGYPESQLHGRLRNDVYPRY